MDTSFRRRPRARSRGARLNFLECLSTAGESFDNRLHGGGPHEGLRVLVHVVKKSSIAACNSSTLPKEPRRIRLLVSSLNQRSTRFNQLELVGTKCATNRGWRDSHARTRGCLCVP